MATRRAECRLAGFLVTSFILETVELLLDVWILYYLYSSGALMWFAVCTGVMVTSLVGSQLLSCQIRKEGRAPEEAGRVFVISHVVLAGLCWRYGRLAMSCHLAVSRAEIWHCFAVNVFNAFTRSFPLLLITAYLILKGELSARILLSEWLLLASAVTSLLAIVRTLVVYRKPSWICCVSGAVAPPRSALWWKIPWRIAEVLTRILSASSFAAIHGSWILLVFGLHWLTSLSLLVIDHIRVDGTPEAGNKDGDVDRREQRKKRALLSLVVSSYIHVFLGFDVTSGKSRLVGVLYLVLCCTECLTLTVLWLLYETRHGLKLPVTSIIACSQLTVIVCAAGYRGFRLKKPPPGGRSDDVCYFQCLACRLSDRGTRHRNMLIDDVRMYASTGLARVDRRPATSGRPSTTRSRDSDNSQAAGIDLSWDDFDLRTSSGHVTATVQPTHPDKGRATTQTTPPRLIKPPAFRPTPHDPGYFSGISSSSSKDPGRQPTDESFREKTRIPLFPRTCDGYWNDDTSSTITWISSPVHSISHSPCSSPVHSISHSPCSSPVHSISHSPYHAWHRDDFYSLDSSMTCSTSTTCSRLTPDLRLPVGRRAT